MAPLLTEFRFASFGICEGANPGPDLVIDLDSRSCGACVFYETPRCIYIGFKDVIQRGDAACAAFYPLSERLRIEKRLQTSAEKFIRRVEEL